MPETRTSRPHATGYISGDMAMSPYGMGRYSIAVDPRARDRDQFRLKIDERFGPQITDHRDYLMLFSRRAIIELRDALTAAIDWEDADEHD